MVFRLGLNGLMGPWEKFCRGSLYFGNLCGSALDYAIISWHGASRVVTEQIVILTLRLHNKGICLQVHTHELHTFPLAVDHIRGVDGGLTGGRRKVYRAGPPKGGLYLGLQTFISAT